MRKHAGTGQLSSRKYRYTVGLHFASPPAQRILITWKPSQEPGIWYTRHSSKRIISLRSSSATLWIWGNLSYMFLIQQAKVSLPGTYLYSYHWGSADKKTRVQSHPELHSKYSGWIRCVSLKPKQMCFVWWQHSGGWGRWISVRSRPAWYSKFLTAVAIERPCLKQNKMKQNTTTTKPSTFLKILTCGRWGLFCLALLWHFSGHPIIFHLEWVLGKEGCLRTLDMKASIQITGTSFCLDGKSTKLPLHMGLNSRNSPTMLQWHTRSLCMWTLCLVSLSSEGLGQA